MKNVSIQDLKKNLSALLSEASTGNVILITRHKKPLACLGPADRDHLHLGRKFGKGSLKAHLRQATKGRYLDFLQEDRRGDPDGR